MNIRILSSLIAVTSALCALSSANGYTVEAGTFLFHGHPIFYERATSSKLSGSKRNSVLLLNGFGVGSFHQHRLIGTLLGEGVDTNSENVDMDVYAMDYLGQGKSWPNSCSDGESPAERGLMYSGNTWVEQITDFLEHVVCANGEKVHLVGNSVGGHLAAFVAAVRPELVASVALMNATPVWGLNLPGWSGKLPAPGIPKAIGRYLFDIIRDPSTIQTYLETCYGHPEAFDDKLVEQIHGCTVGRGGHAAFASIMWSPPVEVTLTRDGSSKVVNDFYDCLTHIQCPTLLLFGADDPWCKPAFAKRMLTQLESRPSASYESYVEIAGVGHCPNHEAPVSVASVLKPWISHVEEKKSVPVILEGKLLVQESWGRTFVEEKSANDISVDMVDRVATMFA